MSNPPIRSAPRPRLCDTCREDRHEGKCDDLTLQIQNWARKFDTCARCRLPAHPGTACDVKATVAKIKALPAPHDHKLFNAILLQTSDSNNANSNAVAGAVDSKYGTPSSLAGPQPGGASSAPNLNSAASGPAPQKSGHHDVASGRFAAPAGTPTVGSGRSIVPSSVDPGVGDRGDDKEYVVGSEPQQFRRIAVAFFVAPRGSGKSTLCRDDPKNIDLEKACPPPPGRWWDDPRTLNDYYARAAETLQHIKNTAEIGTRVWFHDALPGHRPDATFVIPITNHRAMLQSRSSSRKQSSLWTDDDTRRALESRPKPDGITTFAVHDLMCFRSRDETPFDHRDKGSVLIAPFLPRDHQRNWFAAYTQATGTRVEFRENGRPATSIHHHGITALARRLLIAQVISFLYTIAAHLEVLIVGTQPHRWRAPNFVYSRYARSPDGEIYPDIASYWHMHAPAISSVTGQFGNYLTDGCNPLECTCRTYDFFVIEHNYDWSPEQIWRLAFRTERRAVIMIYHCYAAPVGETAGGEHKWERSADGITTVTVGDEIYLHKKDLSWMSRRNVPVAHDKSLHIRHIETGMDGSWAVMVTALSHPARVTNAEATVSMFAAISSPDSSAKIDDPKIGPFIHQFSASPLVLMDKFIVYTDKLIGHRYIRLPCELIAKMNAKIAGDVGEDSMKYLLRTFTRPANIEEVKLMIGRNANWMDVITRCAHISALLMARQAVDDEARNVAVRQHVRVAERIRADQVTVCTWRWLLLGAMLTALLAWIAGTLYHRALLAIWPMPLHTVCDTISGVDVSCREVRMPYDFFSWLYYYWRGVSSLEVDRCGILDFGCHLTTFVGFKPAPLAVPFYPALVVVVSFALARVDPDIYRRVVDWYELAASYVSSKMLICCLVAVAVLAMIPSSQCDATWYGHKCEDGTWGFGSLNEWSPPNYNAPIPVLSFAGSETQLPPKPMRLGAQVWNYTETPMKKHPIQFAVGIVTQIRPQVFARCAHNEYIALRNRLALVVPEPNLVWWNFHVGWVMDEERFEYIFPYDGEFHTPSVPQWIREGNYSGKQRREFESAADDIKCNRVVEADIYRISGFGKLENGQPIALNEVIDKVPRLVGSSTPHYVVLVAPTIREAARIIKEAWSLDHYITYAPGHNGVGLGKFADDDDLQISECDYSRYDSTRHRHSHALFRKILIRLGANATRCLDGRKVTEVMKKGELFRGRTHHGIKFVIPDVLGSGRPDTSLSNGVINGTSKFAAACYAAHADFKDVGPRIKKFVSIPIIKNRLEYPPHAGVGDWLLPPGDDHGSTWEARWVKESIRNGARCWMGDADIAETKFKSVVSGDDHVARHKPINLTRVDVYDCNLGFMVERTERNTLSDATFCSAKFYPALVDGRRQYVLAPEWRRVVTRLGWCVTPAVNPYKIKTRYGLAKGNALSLCELGAAVPVLRHYIATLLRITDGYDAIVDRRNKHRDFQLRTGNHSVEFHPDSYDVAGTSETEEREIARVFDTVDSLPFYVRIPSLSVINNENYAMFVAPIAEELFRQHVPHIGLIEAVFHVLSGQFLLAFVALFMHLALSRVQAYYGDAKLFLRVLMHFLWNVGSIKKWRPLTFLVIVLVIALQPVDAACSPAQMARASETITNTTHSYGQVDPFILVQSFQRGENANNHHQIQLQNTSATLSMPERNKTGRRARAIVRAARRQRRAVRRERRIRRRTARVRTGRARKLGKSRRATTRMAKDVGGPLRRGIVLGPGAKIEKVGKAERADTGESGTRFVCTQELCSIATGASVAGDTATLKFGAGSPQSSAVLDAFVMSDRVLQEAVMFGKIIFRGFEIEFNPLAGEAVAGSVTLAIVEDADAAATQFSGNITRQKIEDTDNNKMFPVTRKQKVLTYRTHSRSLFTVDSETGEDARFYAQLVLIGLITGATTANTTYGILQARIIMDVYGRAPIQSLIQDTPHRRMYILRHYFRHGELPTGMTREMLRQYAGEMHDLCRRRHLNGGVGMCNGCRVRADLERDVKVSDPSPTVSALMYGVKADGSVAPINVDSKGNLTAVMSGTKADGSIAPVKIEDTGEVKSAQYVRNDSGVPIPLRSRNNGIPIVSVTDPNGNNPAYTTGGGAFRISDSSGNNITASSGALKSLLTNASGTALKTVSDGTANEVLGAVQYVAPLGVATTTAASAAGVLKSMASTAAGTDLTTANGVATAITAIGTTTSAVASGYLAVGAASGDPLQVAPMLSDPKTGEFRRQAGAQVVGDGVAAGVATPMTAQNIYDSKDDKFVAVPQQTAINGARPALSTLSFPCTGVARVDNTTGTFRGYEPSSTDTTTLPLVLATALPPSGIIPRFFKILDNGSAYVNTTLDDGKIDYVQIYGVDVKGLSDDQIQQVQRFCAALGLVESTICEEDELKAHRSASVKQAQAFVKRLRSSINEKSKAK